MFNEIWHEIICVHENRTETEKQERINSWRKKSNIKTEYVQLLDLLIFLYNVFYLIYIWIFLLYNTKGSKDLHSNLYCYYILLQTCS